MNRSIFWRVVWKEYRVQRAFWIAMAALTAMLQLIVVITMTKPDDRTELLFYIGLAFPALFALGCGATLFATEHETETYEFQRSLPVSGWRLFLGKVACAVMATSAMVAALWFVALVLAGWQLPSAERHGFIWGAWGMAAVEGLAWGIFFSLLSRWPLRAAMLAVAAGSFCVHFLVIGFGSPWELKPYLLAVPYRAVVVAVLGLANVWLGYRWFHDGHPAARGIGRWRKDVATGDATGSTSIGVTPSRVTIIGRLIWQQWRQSIRTMAVLGSLLGSLVFVGGWIWSVDSYYGLRESRLEVVVFLAALAAALMGSWVFLADQRRSSFRFLTEHGLRPGHVWLSRQLAWLMPLSLSCGVLMPLFLIGNSSLNYRWYRATDRLWGEWYWDGYDSVRTSVLIGDPSHMGMLVVCIGLGYGSGQLCSMLFRSGVLATVFGLISTIVLYCWAMLMSFWDISWWWSVAPIPLFLLLATRLRTASWLLQRNRPRAWIPAALVVLVPLAALLVAVPWHRVESIPDVPPGFSPEEYARPITAEEQQTADMYRRAEDLIVPMGRLFPEVAGQEEPEEEPTAEEPVPSAKMIGYVEANQEAIALALRASQREECSFFDPLMLKSPPAGLNFLLLNSGGVLQAEGKLDAALERYLAVLRFSVHLRERANEEAMGLANRFETGVYRRLSRWAAHPQQTSERIVNALRAVEKITGSLSPLSDARKSDYLRLRQIIAVEPAALAAMDMAPIDVSRLTLWARYLPWEQARARRLLNWRMVNFLHEFQGLQWDIAPGRKVPWWERSRYWRRIPEEPQFTLREEISLPGGSNWREKADDLIRDFTDMEANRRAVRLLLALTAFRCDHGRLPETLDELVGPYLEQVPSAPFSSGEPFRYRPHGVPIPLEHDRWSRAEIKTVPAGEPFVWCTGWRVDIWQNRRGEGEEEEVEINYAVRGEWNRDRMQVETEFEVWRYGWIFRVPQ